MRKLSLLLKTPRTSTIDMRSVINTLLVSALAASSVLADNFVASCDANSVKISGRYVTADCKDVFNNLQCSKLDLNKCLKNNYGSLQEDPKGDGWVKMRDPVVLPLYNANTDLEQYHTSGISVSLAVTTRPPAEC
jgi:hypothetical protein